MNAKELREAAAVQRALIRSGELTPEQYREAVQAVYFCERAAEALEAE